MSKLAEALTILAVFLIIITLLLTVRNDYKKAQAQAAEMRNNDYLNEISTTVQLLNGVGVPEEDFTRFRVVACMLNVDATNFFGKAQRMLVSTKRK